MAEVLRGADGDLDGELDLAAAEWILAALRAAGPAPVVIVDGPSGAGKSTLADTIIAAWPTDARTPQLLRMDDLVPGWDGLAAGSAALADLLGRRAGGVDATWRAWDWITDQPGALEVVRADRPVVVEGSGAITVGTAPIADLAVWVELNDEPERRRRAIARDGEVYAPHWARWAAQEAEHRRRHAPSALADLVVDRTPR